MKKRVGIIGGGAAGLFAACHIKRLNEGSDMEVTLIDRNPVPGKKLILTGHGRCNITNRKDASALKKCYHEAEKFIYPALKEFGPEDTMAFVENGLGLKLKEEENKAAAEGKELLSRRLRNWKSSRPACLRRARV